MILDSILFLKDERDDWIRAIEDAQGVGTKEGTPLKKDEPGDTPLHEDAQDDHGVEGLMSGTLHRKTGRLNRWKDRWFVLSEDGQLERYTEENGELRNRMDVRSAEIIRYHGGMIVEDLLFGSCIHVIVSFVFLGRDFAFQIGPHVLAASSAVRIDHIFLRI